MDTTLSITTQNRFRVWEVYLQVRATSDDESVKPYQPMRDSLFKRSLNPLDQRIRKLRTSIEKDVVRTYQEYPTFRQSSTQQMMINVLLVYGLQNEDVSYRQGMNEILGVLIHAKPSADEQELYYLFDAIMNTLGHRRMFMFSKKNNLDNPLLQRIQRIYNHLLRKHDLELFRYFSLHALQPEIFLIRWIKCLLAREFDVNTTLILWDHMFQQYHSTKRAGIESLDHLVLNMILLGKQQCYELESPFEMIRTYLNYQPIDISRLIAMSTKTFSQGDEATTEEIELKDACSSIQSSAIVGLVQSLHQGARVEQPSKLSILDIIETFNLTTGLVKLGFMLKNNKDKTPHELHELDYKH